MSESTGSLLKRDLDRALACRKEAVIFLASVIPRREAKRIRKAIESNLSYEREQSMFLGTTVRNALRIGGFFYLPETLDFVWYSWLKEAVNLPEDGIAVTDSLKERVRKYRAVTRRAVLRPPLDQEEVERIRKLLEKRHSIRLPEVEVRYSDNIEHAFSIPVVKLPPGIPIAEVDNLVRIRNLSLESEGLKDGDLDRIDMSKFTIFLQRRYANYPAGLYGDLWHELAHAVAIALGLKDKDYIESFAVAYSFYGLLVEVNNGKLPVEKACDQMEQYIQGAKSSLAITPHFGSLCSIEHYNPRLEFRARDPDAVLAELDRSIRWAIDTDREIHEIVQKRRLSRVEKPFIITLGLAAAVLFAVSAVTAFL